MRTELALIVAVVGLSFQDRDNSGFTGEFRIKLVDAPAVYDQVNVVVRRISVQRASASATFGWSIISEDVAIEGLMQMRNGAPATIVLASLSSGAYDGLTVPFGTSSVFIDGFEHTVDIRAGIRNGASVDASFVAEEGKVIGLTFDMDVSKSIRLNAKGRYELRPVIRVQRTDLAGSIAGAVAPDSIQAVMSTVAGEDSVATFSHAQLANNSFRLVDLPEIVYDQYIASVDPRFVDTLITSVSVVPKQTTNVCAIALRLRTTVP